MKHFSTFLLVFVSMSVSAQVNKKADSLYGIMQTSKVDTTRIKATLALTRIVRKTNPDSAMHMLERTSAETWKKKYHQLYFQSESQRAWVYHHMGRIPEGEKVLFQSLKSKFIDHESELNCYIALSHMYTIAHKFSESLKYSLKLIRKCEEYKKPDFLVNAYNNLGNLYSSWFNEEGDTTLAWKAVGYFEKCDSIAEKQEMTDFKQNVLLLNLAMAYGNCKLYDKAEKAYQKTFEVLGKSINHSGYAMALGNYADMMNTRNEVTGDLKYSRIGLEYASKSIEQATIAQYTAIMPNLLIIRAKANAPLKNWKAVESDANLLLRDYSETSAELLAIAWHLLYQSAEARKDYANALDFYKKYNALQDSSDKEENISGLHELQTQYESEKKDRAIEKLNQDKKNAARIQEADNARNRIIIYSILGGLLLVIVFSVSLFNRFRLTKKQKQVIEKQKELVEEKQREILDSIVYAKRLQDAILPPVKLFKEKLNESFILFKPKDIVAGDFYWMEQKDGIVFFAAADCTGHGVPGAMVSVVCSNALSRAVKEFGITDPGKILDKVRELVIETFEKSESEVKDGMDISLCALKFRNSEGGFRNGDKEGSAIPNPQSEMSLLWAGANNPLWIVRSAAQEIEEIKPDKQPIGFFAEARAFTSHHLLLNKGDSIYIFTDGFADQFGGDPSTSSGGKKFKASNLKKLILMNQKESMDAQYLQMNTSFETWRGNFEQIDDVCVMGVRV